MTFTRYFDRSIREWIDTPELHDLVVRIRGMNVDEVVAYSKDLQTECRIDPNYKNTKEFKVAAKTTMRVIQECRRRGERPTRWVGPKPSIFQGVEAIMHGVIVGDEFVKRLKS